MGSVKKSKRNLAGRDESQPESNEAADDPQDVINPPNIQVQIDNIATTLQEHSEALQALKDVPNILSSLSSAFQYDDEEDFSEIADEDSSKNDEKDLLEQYAATEVSCDSAQNRGQDEDNEMLEILNVSQPVNEYGEALNESVASSFTRMIENHPQKDKIEKWKGEYKPPENCKFLGVPRVNSEIWPQLNSHNRHVDLNWQQHGSYLSQALVAVSRIANKVFTSGKVLPKDIGQELLQLSMDAGSVLGLASQELSAKRKAEIKTSLSEEFGAICSSKAPTTEWLFGANVLDQLKASRSASNIIKPAFGNAGKFMRAHPYRPRQPLNFRRPPLYPRGGYMGRQRNPRGGFQNPSSQFCQSQRNQAGVNPMVSQRRRQN